MLAKLIAPPLLGLQFCMKYTQKQVGFGPGQLRNHPQLFSFKWATWEYRRVRGMCTCASIGKFFICADASCTRARLYAKPLLRVRALYACAPIDAFPIFVSSCILHFVCFSPHFFHPILALWTWNHSTNTSRHRMELKWIKIIKLRA